MSLATCPSVADLSLLFKGGSKDSVIEELETHVANCAACLARLKRNLPSHDTLTDALAGSDTLPGPIQNPILLTVMKSLKSASTRYQVAPMISLACPSCQKKLSVKELHQGKKVKCPGCGQAVLVPQPAATAVSAARSEEMQTMPPKSPQIADDLRTVPPKHAPTGDAPTEPPVSKPDSTQSHPDDAADDDRPSLTDFLAPAQHADEIGRLGKYRVLKILGHGGMGVVFKGEDPKLKRLVAIKAMLPALAASASAGKRFLREAQSMAAVEHDNIVRVYQVDEDRGVPFLAMEFLKGEPLDVRLERETVLPIDDVLKIGREMAQALRAAHSHGLVHRDIKPGNVWLEIKDEGERMKDEEETVASSLSVQPSSFRVKILDFGLARASQQDSGLTQQGAIIGTPAYMAPEQARGDVVDARSDLWSLGVALYRMCTGCQPFSGNDTVSTLMAVALHEPAAPHSMNAKLPPGLSALVMGLLEKDSAKRIASADEVVKRIRALERERTQTPAQTTLVPKSVERTTVVPQTLTEQNPPRRRRPWIVAGMLGFLALIVAAVFVIRLQNNEGEFIVEVEDDSVTVALDKLGDLKLVDKKSGKEYSVKSQKMPTGEYELRVNDTAAGLEFSARTFAINSKDAARVRVSFKKKDEGVAKTKTKTPPTTAPPTPAGRYKLEFDANSKIDVSSLTEPPNKVDWTLEGYVVLDEKSPHGRLLGFGNAPRFEYFTKKPGPGICYYSVGPTSRQGPFPVALGKRVHFASVRNAKVQAVYIDGKMLDGKGGPSQLGVFQLGGGFIGSLDEIRISKIARYDQDFTPPARFTPDADTVALYHCDENSGDKLIDSSGNGHHGKIEGAKWTRTGDSRPLPNSGNFVLEFDGKSIVTLPKEVIKPENRKEFSKEFTLEAWAKPTQFRNAVVGNVIVSSSYFGGLYIEGKTPPWTARLGLKNQPFQR